MRSCVSSLRLLGVRLTGWFWMNMTGIIFRSLTLVKVHARCKRRGARACDRDRRLLHRKQRRSAVNRRKPDGYHDLPSDLIEGNRRSWDELELPGTGLGGEGVRCESS